MPSMAFTSTNASYVRRQSIAAGRYLQVVPRSHTTRATLRRTNGARRGTRGGEKCLHHVCESVSANQLEGSRKLFARKMLASFTSFLRQ